MPSEASYSPTAPAGQCWTLTRYVWVILKNLLGWILILGAFVLGPLIPGPNGIPMFLIGFALISFPGKRRLVSRVLRGRRIRLTKWRYRLAAIAMVLVFPAITIGLGSLWFSRLAGFFQDGHRWSLAGAYLLAVAITALWGYILLRLINSSLRYMPGIRRKVRPWMRSHRIHLLPPRYRRPLPHEHGSRRITVEEEILRFLRRPSGKATSSR